MAPPFRAGADPSRAEQVFVHFRNVEFVSLQPSPATDSACHCKSDRFICEQRLNLRVRDPPP